MYIRKVFVFISLFLISTLPAAIYAQATSDTLRAELEEVVIEAAYSPISIGQAAMSVSYNLRSEADMASRRGATMDELTFAIPGVSISNRENYALGERMTIRGLGWRSPFGVRGVQVLLDGLPLTVADGQTIMNTIDPAMVRRVELLRGPSATFWGNSSGGVLYLSTIPHPDQPKIQYRTYGGSHSTIKQELRFQHSFDRSRVYGYGTYFETDGYRDHSAAQLFRGSIGSEHQLSSTTTLKLNANYTGMPKAEHPGALTRELFESDPTFARQNFVDSRAGKNFDQAIVGASIIHDFDSGILDLSTHGTYRSVENPLPFGYVGVDRLAGGVRGTYSFTELPFNLNIGSEFKMQYDERLQTDNIEGRRGDDIQIDQTEIVTNQALFSNARISLTDRLSVSAGLRADWIRFTGEDAIGNELEGGRNFLSLNPSLGAIYRLPNSQLFANFSTSFEAPTTSELKQIPEPGNTNNDRSGFNQSLNPERAISFETGIRGTAFASNIEYDVTAFIMRVHNILVPFEIDSQTFFENRGDTDHYGLETSIQADLLENLTVQLMGTWLIAEFNTVIEDGENLDGNKLPGVPNYRFGSSVNYRLMDQFFTFDSEWVSSYPVNNINSEYTDSYFIHHAKWTTAPISLSSDIKIRPFTSVNNLFNTRYITSANINAAFGGFFYEPGSDRNVQFGIQVSFL